MLLSFLFPLGLCPDWETWDPSQPVENAREAMQQADDWLGVPQVIAPEEIVDPNVDEHSVMTYLSQFPKAKLKPGAPTSLQATEPQEGQGLRPRHRAPRQHCAEASPFHGGNYRGRLGRSARLYRRP
ncbi:filamin-C-like [Heteronotia binoei]|uniref:filamin-C-like n=1 Tax=Heteronotia binoei TaxID=13085 RepID=UPI00292E911E|nr:filamin-C-like [Heteronotia binoei]